MLKAGHTLQQTLVADVHVMTLHVYTSLGVCIHGCTHTFVHRQMPKFTSGDPHGHADAEIINLTASYNNYIITTLTMNADFYVHGHGLYNSIKLQESANLFSCH